MWLQLGTEGREAHQVGEQHHATGPAPSHLGPDRARLTQDVAQEGGRHPALQQLVQVCTLLVLPEPLGPGPCAAPQQRCGHQQGHRGQPMGQKPGATGPEQACSRQPRRDRHGGTHLATTPQRAGHQQGPTAQQKPVQGGWQRLEAPLRLHRGQGSELNLGAALGTERGFLLIPKPRRRGTDQHGAAPPEALLLLQHLPGRHLGQSDGGPAELDPHRLLRYREIHRPIGQGHRVGSRKIAQFVVHPGPAWNGLRQALGGLQQGC